MRMTGQLGNLPGGQVLEYGLGQANALFLQTTNLFRDIHLAAIADQPQLLDLRFQFCDGLLKFEEIRVHLSASSTRLPESGPSVAGPWRIVTLSAVMQCRNCIANCNPGPPPCPIGCSDCEHDR